MVGLRDVLVVTPAASFHHHHHHDSLLHPTDHPHVPFSSIEDSQRGKAPAGIQFWQAQPQQLHNPNPNPNPNPNLSYLKKPVPMIDVSGSGYATCQDCGNQAKKDCIHRRCRTCCKSRGFDCTTHVKSTWVPAARRRERQFSVTAAAAGSSSTSGTKKPRLQTTPTTSTSTTPRSHDATSSRQDASFRESLPGQVRAPAVFKCVKVTSMEDGEDEYAYQAMVRIGGHTFKGFLYDQGQDSGQGGDDQTQITGEGNNAIPNISELHLGGAGAGPSDVYGGGGGFLQGTNYGNQIN